MTSPPRRTVDDFAAPYVNFLVRVPAAGVSVCRICHSTVGGTYAVCYQCHEAGRVLGSSTADLTAFVSMAPVGEQFAHELLTYKKPTVGADERQKMTVGLAAVLWKWLGLHKQCMTRRLGIQDFDAITTVPSTSGRTAHPLPTVVSGVVVGSDAKYADLLELARTDLEPHTHAADRFRAKRRLGGKSVLIIDDTWTAGANAQSASAAVKAVGASTVAVLAIGQWYTPSWNPGGVDGTQWLADHRKPGWEWERCCLDSD